MAPHNPPPSSLSSSARGDFTHYHEQRERERERESSENSVSTCGVCLLLMPAVSPIVKYKKNKRIEK
jgi:hypothetical protein